MNYLEVVPSRSARQIGIQCDFVGRIPQNFSIPFNIVYFIFKNTRNPSVFQKLTKTCKYFLAKYSIFVLNEMIFIDGEDLLDQTYLTHHKHKFWVDRIYIYNFNNLTYQFLRNKVFRITELHIYSGEAVLDQIIRPEIASCIKQAYFCKALINHEDGTPMLIENVFKFFPNLECFGL